MKRSIFHIEWGKLACVLELKIFLPLLFYMIMSDSKKKNKLVRLCNLNTSPPHPVDAECMQYSFPLTNRYFLSFPFKNVSNRYPTR